MKRKMLACVAAVMLWAGTVSGQGSVYEQVLVQNIGIPNYLPTASRTTIVVNGQSTSKGMISGSQFYGRVCGTYTFQQGYEVQQSTGPDPIAFAYLEPGAIFRAGPALTAGVEHTFTITADGLGSFTWDVDGQPFYTFYAGCNSLSEPYNALGGYEQILPQSTKPIRLQDLVITKVFSFLVDGAWVDGSTGQGLRDGYTCPARGCSFDARGMLDDSTLAPNQVKYSSRYRFSTGSVLLW